MQKKNKKQTKPIKQIIIYIAIAILILLLVFAEDIIKLANKNKIGLLENTPTETTPAEPNVPVISAGMIPVKWDGTNWIITTREDEDWYNYKNGKLAYVMLNDGYYRSEIEQGVEDEQLMENSVGVGVPDDPSICGTIFVWIPRFAYNKDGDIQYIKDIESADENWTIPDLFTHVQESETAPDFLLTGVWLEKDVDNQYSNKITGMNQEESIYGFIKNTVAVASNQTAQNTIQTYITNLVGVDGSVDPSNEDISQTIGASIARPQIGDIANPNRIILKIINQKNQNPIKAKGAYNKQTGLIEIQVTYSQYGINKIMLEETELTINKNNNRATATSEGIELENGKTYKARIIDNKGNTKELEIQVIFPIYATLYTDGTLAFGKTENPISTKTKKQEYGDISRRVDYMPWKDNATAIKTANIVDKILPTSTAYWFYDCINLTTISNISNLDTSKVTSMAYMFSDCSGLTLLDITSFNTSNVTNMKGMFYGCSNLTKLNVSNFDTSNVTDMFYMFCGCSGLTSLDVSNFDTSNVTDMNCIFRNCSKLTSLNISNFNTSKLTNMSYMFYGCRKLELLNISNFDTSNVTKMSCMFQYCSLLTTLDLSSFDTSNVTSMNLMFSSCTNLKTIYVGEKWTTENATTASMFSGCGTSKVT